MEYNEKNLKICEILGAKQFQQLVFLLEKLKYQIIEKIFPDILTRYDNYQEKSLSRKLAKCNNQEKQQIIDNYRFSKLAFRKELINKQNQNYHLDLENPTYFVNYLKFNRQIHLDGAKSNIIFIILLLLLELISNHLLIDIILVYNILSLLINFQCINLQNYNLCRLENNQMKELLQKREQKITEDKLKKYGEGMKVIGKTFQKTIDIPTSADIIQNIKTPEEKKQLLLYLKKQLAVLENKHLQDASKNKGRCRIK